KREGTARACDEAWEAYHQAREACEKEMRLQR
ncbi:unnamed protein product, partial [marine sediment metagenome]